MTVAFSSISHLVHTKLGKTLPLGHVHQLVSAALGYKSLAAYTASKEEPSSFDAVSHVVLDEDLLKLRQADLEYADSAAVTPLIQVIRAAFWESLPKAQVHLSQVDLEDNIRDAVVSEINDSGEFASEQAITNAGGGDYELDFTSATPLEAVQAEWELKAEGTCTLKQDPENVYHGHQIDVSARVVFPKLGRRLLGAVEAQDFGASIRSDWADDDEGADYPEALQSPAGTQP